MEFLGTGKTYLVTGAGRGIGRAIAIALSKSGAKVYALSRTKETLDTLVEECPDITPIVQDLINWDETRKALEQLEPLDGLVNNAAASTVISPATEFPKEALDFYLQNNLMTVINCTQVVAKKMIDSKKSGSVVNISSDLSQYAFPNFLGYNVAKAGVDMVTKQFALELGPHNIRVNSVNPTLVLTESIQKVKETVGFTVDKIILERTPLGQLPEVKHIVDPVLFLLSDAAAMVTGTSHFVDAGLTCNITTKQ